MTLPPTILRCEKVGPWSLNSYALVCPATLQSVLIDPGAEPESLARMMSGTSPIAILLTHSHGDHLGALGEMRKRLSVPVLAHRGPRWSVADVVIDPWLTSGELVPFGEYAVRVHHAPGHTEDQICISIVGDTRVIVGDTVFEGGPGKTDSEQSFRTTLQTLRVVVLAWPDDTICYPGHGPSFRLGDVRADLETFLTRDHAGFFGDATWDM